MMRIGGCLQEVLGAWITVTPGVVSRAGCRLGRASRHATCETVQMADAKAPGLSSTGPYRSDVCAFGRVLVLASGGEKKKCRANVPDGKHLQIIKRYGGQGGT